MEQLRRGPDRGRTPFRVSPEQGPPQLVNAWTTAHDGIRTRTDLIIVHSTRGGAQNAGAELQATLNWFANPANQASAQDVIAADGTIYQCVPGEKISWGATYLNQRTINIELVQQTPTTPFTEAQYRSVAWRLRDYCQRFGIPYRHANGENEPGIIGHDTTAQGASWGKSDPGQMFDWRAVGL